MQLSLAPPAVTRIIYYHSYFSVNLRSGIDGANIGLDIDILSCVRIQERGHLVVVWPF